MGCLQVRHTLRNTVSVVKFGVKIFPNDCKTADRMKSVSRLNQLVVPEMNDAVEAVSFWRSGYWYTAAVANVLRRSIIVGRKQQQRMSMVEA